MPIQRNYSIWTVVARCQDCSQVDRYLNESTRSFRQCQVKNTARRHSLMKRTLGIEVERRVVAAERTRQEKQLREQLRGMQIDRVKPTLTASVKGQKYATRRGRRQSHEFEDLHVNTTTGKLTLPKLQMLGARSSRSGTPSPYSLSPSPSRRNVDGNWVGDPEAIRSVRRPRKSVEEQGKDRAMLRSQVA
ncbi:uncharacterized protein LOC112566945 [Pomacea canaliculata]|uniref:uncharacterized protein LOC112566945 n=1 Tax=Pomacea canaliculata TaxID=400727 RepID=UPI000D737B54|nr:uncharacterized protein LOC112566945 [Pomacea canaliculata]